MCTLCLCMYLVHVRVVCFRPAAPLPRRSTESTLTTAAGARGSRDATAAQPSRRHACGVCSKLKSVLKEHLRSVYEISGYRRVLIRKRKQLTQTRNRQRRRHTVVVDANSEETDSCESLDMVSTSDHNYAGDFTCEIVKPSGVSNRAKIAVTASTTRQRKDPSMMEPLIGAKVRDLVFIK